MSILTAHNLSKSFGPEEIFAGVSVEIPHGARIALVGPNGAGKTTLLNILAGLDTPSEGGVSRARSLRIGYLPQRPETVSDLTLWDEQMLAFAALRAGEARLMRLSEDMAAPGLPPEAHDRLLAEYGELQERFEAAGGYSYEHRTRVVLHGLGFTPDDYSRPIGLLSGGQKTRALLARLLLEAPGLLALDEPTNHLDIQSVEWLEGYLKDFPGAVLVVSHDRYFMDAVASTIWEMDFGTLETYRGNYSAYARQREERHTRLFKEYEAQQAFIAKEEEYIRRNMAGQNTRQAQGRLKRLNRLKRDDLVLRPRKRREMGLRMSSSLRSGDLVLRTRGLTVGYDDYPLFSAPDLTLRRREVAALIGPNGAGKSTFVKTVIEQIPPLAGQVIVGASVQIGYFAQAHERLDPRQTLIDAVIETKPMLPGAARSYLGGYLFEEDDAFRPISTLSGGERGRLALALLALSGANFLLLDEPTNHLDIASQEALQNVLADYDGTILMVSHDRYLIDALATQIWSISPGRLDLFEGTYAEYIAAREKARLAAQEQAGGKPVKAAPGRPPAEKKHGLSARELQQRIVAAEASIAELETQLAALTTDLEAASTRGDAGRVRALGERYANTETELAAAMAEWERLVS